MTLKLNGSSSGYTAIDAPASAGSNTLTLPANNGSNGQFLQTNGSGVMSWASADTNLPCFFASTNSTTNLTANTWSRLDFGTEEVDSASAFAETAKFTPQTAGYYYTWASYQCRFQSNPHWMYITFRKNGSDAFRYTMVNGRNSDYDNWVVINHSGIVSMNGSSDYLEVYANNMPDTGTTTIPVAQRHFGAFRLGAN